MHHLRFAALVFLLSALAAGASLVRAAAPFEITPPSAAPGEQVSVHIEVDLRAGKNAPSDTAVFCLYVAHSDGALIAETPGDIELSYLQGAAIATANFVQTTAGARAPACFQKGGQTAFLYRAEGLPADTKTYSGSFTATIDAAARDGDYLWTLTLLDAPSGVTALWLTHSVQGPTAVRLAGFNVAGAPAAAHLLAAAFVGLALLTTTTLTLRGAWRRRRLRRRASLYSRLWT